MVGWAGVRVLRRGRLVRRAAAGVARGYQRGRCSQANPERRHI